MVVKTVTLTKDAYDALAALKDEGESFSEVVRRLTGSRMLLSPFAGAWKEAPELEVDKARDFLARSDRLSRSKLRRLSRPEVSRGRSRKSVADPPLGTEHYGRHRGPGA